ncbi:CRISPR-associated RAMP protein, Csx10 family [Halothece sp. PCC 7418]|uniref:type III-D CRISPR-associated RAMP protein Csx10 n=1 Tax=Halothece sp. (strain PCC 7418) TaxID=65093 RepID=UPI0002A06B1D|nr:CRISPR-associated RAMP protein Csx10 [Halothece sp. PCC 7418]AFZ42901.1 CRISPR-associated RAMP protein, Csx10 family [Halothece sp. PCC 7418]
MKTIVLRITAKSPLAIGCRKIGMINEAEDYIPGSVIRGAIAQQILQQTGYQNEDLSQNGGDFQQLFLDNTCAIFQNAYPSPNHQISSVIPATAVSSKTNPGFHPRGNGVFDTLMDRFCAEFYQHPYDPNCPKDTGRVEPFSGFYTVENGNYQTHSVSKRLLMRTGINRRRGVAEEDILYSLEVLNETRGETQPSVYQGKILVGDETLTQAIADYINRNPQRFRLGSAASRGLGKVNIEATVTEEASSVSSRLQNFNQALQTRWQKWGTLLGNTSKQLQPAYFTLNLQSEVILTDQWRKTTLLTPAMLQEETGIKDDSLKLHTAYTSYDYRSGWNSAWGLMKDMELVTNRGGVYLFSTTQPDSWEQELENLENRGIGERTYEGFGQVQICSPFHGVFREEAK